MADTVASSVVQEGVSWMSSYISGKLEEKASEGHILARLDMALCQLEYTLERTGKLPIVHKSLLRRWKMFKEAYMEGMDLLNKHKLQLVEGREEAGQRVTAGSSFLERIPRAKHLPISSLLGLNKEYLSSSVVKKFEWYADCADKFVSDVESGCPLRHDHPFGYPLERQLLEGKVLMCKMVNGSQSHRIALWPVCSEGRGIEVELYYSYEDRKMPVKKFFLLLRQRFSQGPGIVGTAIRCLQFVTESLKLPESQFKCVAESAIGEISLLSSLQDFSHSYAPPPGCTQEAFLQENRLCRPDPICCANNIVSSELSHGVPEPVIGIYFNCSTSAPEYMLHSSSSDEKVPLLHLEFLFLPHVSVACPHETVIVFEGEKELRSVNSMQLMEELLRSRALDCLGDQPESEKYIVCWYSQHGGALMGLEKSRPETTCPKPTVVPRPSRRFARGTLDKCFSAQRGV